MSIHYTQNVFNTLLGLACILNVISNYVPSVALGVDTWSRFRGENGLGNRADCEVTLPWQPTQVIADVKLPGVGNGSPVIWDRTAYLLCANPDNAARKVVAVDIQRGKLLWNYEYASETHPLHKMSSYASSTPCVDESGVYFAWGSPNHSLLVAYTHDGQERWKYDWGRTVSQHGFGTSPIIVDDLIILFASQDAEELPPGIQPGQDRMLAFSKIEGTLVWVCPLKTSRVCYGAPCIAQVGDQSILLCASTSEGFFAIDVKSGKKLWNLPMFSKRICSAPILVGNHLIASEGSGGGGNVVTAVQWKNAASSEKANETPSLAYKIDRSASYVPTVVADGDYLFAWADTGIVSCFDLETGESYWSKRVGGNFSASPVILAGNLINVSADGIATVIKASPKFKAVGTIDIGESVRSTIAATSDRVIVRTDRSLLIIGK